MKQEQDNKTIELIPEIKKRGRPATGEAMTAAERKKAQRHRDMAQMLSFEDIEKITDSGLIALMANAKLRKSIGEIVWREWGRRQGFIS